MYGLNSILYYNNLKQLLQLRNTSSSVSNSKKLTGITKIVVLHREIVFSSHYLAKNSLLITIRVLTGDAVAVSGLRYQIGVELCNQKRNNDCYSHDD